MNVDHVRVVTVVCARCGKREETACVELHGEEWYSVPDGWMVRGNARVVSKGTACTAFLCGGHDGEVGVEVPGGT